MQRNWPVLAVPIGIVGIVGSTLVGREYLAGLIMGATLVFVGLATVVVARLR